jgi:ATP-dependent DNA helicase PIF1
MVSSETLRVMEEIATICRSGRNSSNGLKPWGGLQVIAVGDFAQLPPVEKNSVTTQWAFDSSTWVDSKFKSVMLTEIMRTANESFISVQNHIRNGDCNKEVTDFLNSRTFKVDDNFIGTRLFGRKVDVESFNFKKLQSLPGGGYKFDTKYEAKNHFTAKFTIPQMKKHCPIPETL